MQSPHNPGNDKITRFDQRCSDQRESSRGKPDDNEADPGRLELFFLTRGNVGLDLGHDLGRDRVILLGWVGLLGGHLFAVVLGLLASLFLLLFVFLLREGLRGSWGV